MPFGGKKSGNNTLSFKRLEPAEARLFEGLNDGHELAAVRIVVVAAEERVPQFPAPLAVVSNRRGSSAA